jgi:ribosomal protein S26
MGRGKTTLVRCNGCGRSVSRGKAVVDFRPVVYSTDLRTAEDLRYMEKRKVYYCVSCGKSLGVYEKKKRQNEIYRERKNNMQSGMGGTGTTGGFGGTGGSFGGSGGAGKF